MTTDVDAAAIRKRHGRHYTPEVLADFLADRLLGNLRTGATLRILDPACGDGELLFAVARVARRRGIQAALELVGYDLDDEAIAVARSRAAALGITVALECADFLVASDSIAQDSFDGVITNPPYVRTQQLGGAAAQVLADRFGLQGRIDLTHPFVGIVPRILQPRGVLALLCSNRFLSTKAGANVRSMLDGRLHPVELYDLGDTKLFGAAVLPAIVIATRDAHERPAPYLSAYEAEPADGANPLFDALANGIAGPAEWEGRHFQVSAGTLQKGPTGATPWRMGGTTEESWLEDVERATWKSFAEIAKIRVGIKTTADSVFIGDRWDELSPDVQPEDEILLPLTTHRNMQAWRFEPGRMSVLYPYRMDIDKRTVTDMSEFPRAMAYLESHRERLEGRTYVIEGGREWFEIWVPQRPALWSRPKIVFPDISEGPKFALDRAGAVVNGDCYWISVDEIGDESLALLMLGVANSATAVRFYDHVCGNKLYAGRRRWISQYVGLLPVPDPTTAEAAAVIEHTRALVEGMTPDTSAQEHLDALVVAAFNVRQDAPTVSETLF